MQSACTDELQQATTVLSACTGSFTRKGCQLVICSNTNLTLWTIEREPQLLQTCPLLNPAQHVRTVKGSSNDRLCVWHTDGRVSVWAGKEGILQLSVSVVASKDAASDWKDAGQKTFLPQSCQQMLSDGEVLWASHAGGGGCAIWSLAPGADSPEPVVGGPGAALAVPISRADPLHQSIKQPAAASPVLHAVSRELEEASSPNQILAVELLGCTGPAGPSDRAFAVAVLSSSRSKAPSKPHPSTCAAAASTFTRAREASNSLDNAASHVMILILDHVLRRPRAAGRMDRTAALRVYSLWGTSAHVLQAARHAAQIWPAPRVDHWSCCC